MSSRNSSGSAEPARTTESFTLDPRGLTGGEDRIPGGKTHWAQPWRQALKLVDPAADGALSDGNGVLEPGETFPRNHTTSGMWRVAS